MYSLYNSHNRNQYFEGRPAKSNFGGGLYFLPGFGYPSSIEESIGKRKIATVVNEVHISTDSA